MVRDTTLIRKTKKAFPRFGYKYTLVPDNGDTRLSLLKIFFGEKFTEPFNMV